MRAVRSDKGRQHASKKRRTLLFTGADQKEWKFKRKAYFNRNVNFAAAARATRTALDVTQAEIAREFGCSVGAVTNWESGCYGWPGGASELEHYQQICAQIARR